MKKRALMLLLGFLVIALAAGATPWLLFSDGPRFTEAQATKIKPGMTESEVIEILGAASGSYTTSLAVYYQPSIEPVVPPGTKYEKSWCGDHGMIEVGFDDNDRTTYRQFYQNGSAPPKLWQRVKDCVAWQ